MNHNTKLFRTTILYILLLWVVCGVGAYLNNPYMASECVGIARKNKAAIHYEEFACLKPSTVTEVVKKNIILVISGPLAFLK